MSTREDQIMTKAKEKVIDSVDSGMDEETAWIYGFYHGANWSDSNPESGIKATFDDLQGPGIVKLSLEDGRSLSIDLSKFVNEIGKLRGAIDIETNNKLFLLDQIIRTPEDIEQHFRDLCTSLRKLL